MRNTQPFEMSPVGGYCIHAFFNKSGRRLEFLIYDVIRGKASAAICEF